MYLFNLSSLFIPIVIHNMKGKVLLTSLKLYTRDTIYTPSTKNITSYLQHTNNLNQIRERIRLKKTSSPFLKALWSQHSEFNPSSLLIPTMHNTKGKVLLISLELYTCTWPTFHPPRTQPDTYNTQPTWIKIREHPRLKMRKNFIQFHSSPMKSTLGNWNAENHTWR